MVNDVVVPEEWQENFRMTGKGLPKLTLPNVESKTTTYKPYSVDAEHIIRFHAWTQNICSVLALKVAFQLYPATVDEVLISKFD